MIRHTCSNCNKELACLKNEIPVIHFMDNDKSKGIDAMVYGDLWGCNKCGAEVVLSFGKQILGMDISIEKTKYILEHRYIEVKR